MTRTIERYRKGDAVITPCGDKAVVQAVIGDWLVLKYRDVIPGAEAEFTLHAKLVAKYVPGLRLPLPVRLDCDGRIIPATLPRGARAWQR